MIPVHQTILACPIRGDGHDADGRPGDCYRAAIASVLDLPIDEVPYSPRCKRCHLAQDRIRDEKGRLAPKGGDAQ